MIVLGIESSTPVASAALVTEGGLKGEIILNIGLTHSEQLLPLIDDLLTQTRIPLSQVEGIAVARGPGSFTGLRIGMATAKGLAQGRGIPLVGVSTLLGLAETQRGSSLGYISPVMNARKKEVYAALYENGVGGLKEVLPQQAVDPLKWVQELAQLQGPLTIIGDGAKDYLEIWRELPMKGLHLPPDYLSVNRAASIAWLGREMLLRGQHDDLYKLKPSYIRLAEAQLKLNCPK